jgi:hypothetical protein
VVSKLRSTVLEFDVVEGKSFLKIGGVVKHTFTIAGDMVALRKFIA